MPRILHDIVYVSVYGAGARAAPYLASDIYVSVLMPTRLKVSSYILEHMAY